MKQLRGIRDLKELNMYYSYPVGVYPGERPEKCIARLLTYSTMFRAVGPKTFMRGRHVVLGGEGGDIELLLSLGVPAKQIVAVEREIDLYKRLARRFPAIDLRCADVVDVVRNLNKTGGVVSLNLDLCNVLSTSTVDIVVQSFSALDRSVVFSMTFSASREKDIGIRRAVVKAETQLRRSAFRSAFDGYEKPMSRATVGFQRLQQAASLELTALRFVAYRAIGLSVPGNLICRSMAVVIGTTGVATVPECRYIAVGALNTQALASELTCLSLQTEATQRHKRCKEAQHGHDSVHEEHAQVDCRFLQSSGDVQSRARRQAQRQPAVLRPRDSHDDR